MQALQIEQTGHLEGLRLVELPTPKPAAGQVLVQVHASGLNPSDVKNVLGRFPYTTLPRVPGRDFAGVVVEGPAEWKGQAVWGTGRDLGFFHDGSHAEYLTLPVGGLSHKPASLSFVQAASCGVPFTTALDAIDRAGVVAGTRLLVIGAGGAVGRAAVSMARARGADVVAAVRRGDQARVLKAEGWEVVQIDGQAELRDVLSPYFPNGAEVIFDTTGFWLQMAVDALANFGRIAVIAAPLDGHVNVPVLKLYRRGGSIVGVNSLLYDSADCAAMLTRIGELFDTGQISAPDGLQARSLREGLTAYEEVNRSSTAKIVLKMI